MKNIRELLATEITNEEESKVFKLAKDVIIKIRAANKMRDVWIERRQAEKVSLTALEEDVFKAAEDGNIKLIKKLQRQACAVGATANVDAYHKKYGSPLRMQDFEDDENWGDQ